VLPSEVACSHADRPASEHLDGSQETSLTEHRRMEPAGELPQLVIPKGKLVACLREDRARCRRIGSSLVSAFTPPPPPSGLSTRAGRF
jgi:hypothetical protein